MRLQALVLADIVDDPAGALSQQIQGMPEVQDQIRRLFALSNSDLERAQLVRDLAEELLTHHDSLFVAALLREIRQRRQRSSLRLRHG